MPRPAEASGPCKYPFVGRAFVYFVNHEAERRCLRLAGDDGVPAIEGLRCLREFEEHATSCSMELVCGKPL